MGGRHRLDDAVPTALGSCHHIAIYIDAVADPAPGAVPRCSYQEIRNAEVGQSIMTTSSCGTVWVESSCGNRHPGLVSTWRRSHPDGEWEATSGHPRSSGRLSCGCPQGWADQSRPIPGKSPGSGAVARLSKLRGQDAANSNAC